MKTTLRGVAQNGGKKAILCLSMVFYFLFISSGFINAQSTVYIDPTYSEGASDGSYEKPFTAWSQITSFINNTSYLQRRGTTANITSPIEIDEKPGITFGVYGDETGYAHINSTYRTGAIFKLQASLKCTIIGFHLTADNFVPDPKDNGTYAIYVVDKNDKPAPIIPNAGDITIKNCLMEHFTWGIRLMEKGHSNLDNILIDSCTIQNIFWDGMFIQSWQGGDGIGGMHGVDINHCYITNVNAAIKYYEDQGILPTQSNAGGDGIQISQYVKNWRIRNTTIDRRGSGLKFCIIHGDELSKHKYGGTVENCTLYTPDRIIGGLRASACYFSILDTINFRYNKVIGNSNSMGIQMRWNTNLNCYYNTFEGFNGTGASNFAVFDVESDVKYAAANNKIHNNTFHNIGTVYYYFKGNDQFDFKNNIFSAVSKVYASNAGVTSNYNLYYPAPASGSEAKSIYNQDPLFFAPEESDFRLRIGSPAINASDTLGYIHDLPGSIVPQGDAPDIGAYEFISLDTLAPNTPDGLIVGNISHTGFTLSWNATNDNGGGTVTGYNVYKDGVLVASKKAPSTSLSITGLTQGVTYAITVAAKDGSGNISPASAVKNVTTTAASDKQAPTVPTSLGTSRVSQGSFVLTWNPSTDASMPVTYDVYRSGELVASVTTSSATITASPGTSYSLTIKVRDIYNNTSASTAAFNVNTLPVCSSTVPFSNTSFETQTETFTAEMDVVPYGDYMNGIVGLSNGVANAFSNLACIVQFNVDGIIRARNGSDYKAENNLSYLAGVNYHIKFVVNVSAHTYDVIVTPAGGAPVTIASSYAFRSEQSAVTQLNNIVVQTISCVLTVNNFVLNTGNNTPVTIFADDMEAGGAAANGLWRTTISGDTNSAWELGIPTMGGPQATHSGTKCWGTNLDGKYSNPVSDAQLITPTINLKGLTSASMTFWVYQDIDKRDGGYLEISTNGGTTWTQIPGSALTPTYDGVITDGTLYAYQNVRRTAWTMITANLDAYVDNDVNIKFHFITNSSFNAWGWYIDDVQVTGIRISDTQAPSVPTGLQAANITSSGFALSWAASADDTEVTKYEVFKNGISIGTTSETAMNVTGLNAGTTYLMTVRASDAAGNWSAQSNPLNVTTLWGVNLALNKTATASSIYNNNPGFSPSKAVDGLLTSRWVSSASANNWLAVDLGSFYSVNLVTIKWTNTGYGRAYTIQVSSNESDWTDVASETENTSGGVKNYSFTAIDCKYVRVIGTALGFGVAQYNIIEFEVYGNASLKSSSLASGVENKEKGMFNIYPNPINHILNIEVANYSELRILNLSGKLLLSKNLEKGLNSIPVDFEPGVYVVQIKGADNEAKTSKLIVQ